MRHNILKRGSFNPILSPSKYFIAFSSYFLNTEISVFLNNNYIIRQVVNTSFREISIISSCGMHYLYNKTRVTCSLLFLTFPRERDRKWHRLDYVFDMLIFVEVRRSQKCWSGMYKIVTGIELCYISFTSHVTTQDTIKSRSST